MTKDQIQTFRCNRFTDQIDSILSAVAEIRRNAGPGEDKADDLLNQIIDDAKRALAINHQIQREDDATEYERKQFA